MFFKKRLKIERNLFFGLKLWKKNTIFIPIWIEQQMASNGALQVWNFLIKCFKNLKRLIIKSSNEIYTKK